MMYSDKVMDHFRNPRNVGEIENASGVGEVGNAKCGDIMKVYLKIEDNIIKDAKFKRSCFNLSVFRNLLLSKRYFLVKYVTLFSICHNSCYLCNLLETKNLFIG